MGKKHQARPIYDSCDECPRGRYGDFEGAATIILGCPFCIVGRFSDQTGVFENNKDGTICKACLVGMWSNRIGLEKESSCINCVAGRYSSTKASVKESDCLGCSEGKFSEKVGTAQVEACLNCPSGYFQSKVGDAYCLPCTPGKHQPGTGQEKCIDCKQGRATNIARNTETECPECISGQTTEGEGSSVCQNCGAGKFGYKCSDCDAGQYRASSANNETFCTECPSGYAHNFTGQAFCLPCTPGLYENENGQNICKHCDQGKFSINIKAKECQFPKAIHVAGPSQAGQVPVAEGMRAVCTTIGNELICTGMERCPGGTKDQTRICVDCTAGTFSMPGSIECQKCMPGKFSATSSNAIGCDECLSGQLAETEGSTECTVSAPGAIVLGGGAVSVVVPEGSYAKECSDENNGQSCTSFDQCPAGWMGHKPADMSCTECDEGTSSTQGTPYNKNGCRTCSKGTYSNKKGTEKCEECSIETYQPQDNNPSTKCIACPTGFSQLAIGESSCIDLGSLKPSDCNDKQYWIPNKANTSKAGCISCPIGASCQGDITYTGVKALFGYYRYRSDSRSIPTNFTQCLFPGACLGAPNREFVKKYYDVDGNDTSIDLALVKNVSESCNEKYGFKPLSRLCHTCAKNYRRVGLHQCKSCPSNAGINWFLIVLGLVVIIAILVVLVIMTIAEAGKTALSESIQKCILNYFQVASLFGNIPLRWPGPMQDFFDFQGAFSTIGEHLVNPDCTATEATAAELFYAKQIAYLALPVLLISIVYIIWKSYAYRTGKEWRRSTEEKERTAIRTRITIKDKFVVTVCILVYLFYPTLCQQAFGLFTCYKVNKKTYLLVDLEESCDSPRRITYVVFIGIPQLILFVVGLPLVGLGFLFRNRTHLDTISVRARYGIFFGGYRKDRYYWEFFLVLRKVAVIAISGFRVGLSAEMQALLLLLVLMLCCGLQHVGQPFEVLVVTLWSGLVMFKLNESYEDPDSRFAHTLLTVATVLINILFVLVLVYILLREIYHEKKADGTTAMLSRIASSGRNKIQRISSLGMIIRGSSFRSSSSRDTAEVNDT